METSELKQKLTALKEQLKESKKEKSFLKKQFNRLRRRTKPFSMTFSLISQPLKTIKQKEHLHTWNNAAWDLIKDIDEDTEIVVGYFTNEQSCDKYIQELTEWAKIIISAWEYYYPKNLNITLSFGITKTNTAYIEMRRK
jgi:archaellum component FlaC